MRRLGLFGGTFNPPHLAHKRLSDEMRERLSLSEVLIMPTFTPPHKEAKSLASSEDRLEMCRRTFSDDFYKVSDLEIKREGKSYTVDTLEVLKKIYPDDEIYLIIGSDMLLSFHKWYRYEDILSLCTLCVISREDEKTAKVLTDYARDVLKRDVEKGEIIISHSAPVELSSTLIREKILKGEDVSAYLEKGTYEFIKEKGLYL